MVLLKGNAKCEELLSVYRYFLQMIWLRFNLNFSRRVLVAWQHQALESFTAGWMLGGGRISSSAA